MGLSLASKRMRDKPFVDTNILFYTSDSRDPDKQRVARDLIRSIAARRDGTISSQVALELAANLVQKMGLHPAEVAARLKVLDSLECVPVTPDIVRTALRLHGEHSISIWDGAILAAAVHASCRVLYSEDLQHGAVIDGIRIVNPFRDAP